MLRERLPVWAKVINCYKSVARIRLMKTENSSVGVCVCATANCEVCRSAIALCYL
jgi:hypothetical protein